VLFQQGNRVQHALRASTPRDQKAVKAAAETMRQKPGPDIEKELTELAAVGEAPVSFLDAKGRPSVTEKAYVLPPGSQLGPITPAQRQALIDGSVVAGAFEKAVHRGSAYESRGPRNHPRRAGRHHGQQEALKPPRTDLPLGRRVEQLAARDGGQHVRHGRPRYRHVVIRLAAQPPAIGQAEIPAQAQIGVGRDRPLAGHDVTNPLGRHADVLGQPVLRQSERFQEFFLEHFTR
jgi:hypothetical protein